MKARERFFWWFKALRLQLAFLLGAAIIGALFLGKPLLWAAALLAYLLLGLVLDVAFVSAYRQWPLKAWSDFLDQIRLALPLGAFVVTLLLVSSLGSREGSATFHEAGAQIIPILLLALALEGRTFQVARFRDPTELFAAFIVLGFLAVGEYCALRAVYSGQPASGDVVAAAIAAGFVGVAVLALSGGPPPPSDERTDRAQGELRPPSSP